MLPRLTSAERPAPWTWISQRQLLFDTLLLGVAGGLIAPCFTWLLHLATRVFLLNLAGYRPPGLASEGDALQQVVGPHGLWLVPVATTLGGLLVGATISWLAPEAEGHGTDAVVRAFHQADGVLRGRVAPVKLVASAITIGSGGAAGREGPIALTAAAVGSWYASIRGRSGPQRRLLLLVGTAAGLAAIFRSPVGAALFAVEVLYGNMDVEAGALPYTMLGAIVAYAVSGFFLGWTPLFEVPGPFPPATAPVLGGYVALGLAAGAFAAVMPSVFYGIRDRFRALPGPFLLKPALGGLLTGLLALAWPQVLGGGYGWIQEAMAGRLALGLLALLAVAKLAALSFSVASGGSGGVFAPSLFSGAMLGGALAAVLHAPPGAFVVVGMAAVFGGAARVPLATLIMVSEMTGGYELLVPAALAVTLSYFVQSRLTGGLRYRSLYEDQVPSRSDSPTHHLEHLRVALQLLQERRIRDPAAAGGVDLLGLLRSGIPLELPDGRHLDIGVLRPASPFEGKACQALEAAITDGGEVVAILRGEHILVPRPDTALAAGDRLILLASAAGLRQLGPSLDRW